MNITFVTAVPHMRAHALNLLLWIICQSHAFALLDKHPIVHCSHILDLKSFLWVLFVLFFFLIDHFSYTKDRLDMWF